MYIIVIITSVNCCLFAAGPLAVRCRSPGGPVPVLMSAAGPLAANCSLSLLSPDHAVTEHQRLSVFEGRGFPPTPPSARNWHPSAQSGHKPLDRRGGDWERLRVTHSLTRRPAPLRTRYSLLSARLRRREYERTHRSKRPFCPWPGFSSVTAADCGGTRHEVWVFSLLLLLLSPPRLGSVIVACVLLWGFARYFCVCDSVRVCVHGCVGAAAVIRRCCPRPRRRSGMTLSVVHRHVWR